MYIIMNFKSTSPKPPQRTAGKIDHSCVSPIPTHLRPDPRNEEPPGPSSASGLSVRARTIMNAGTTARVAYFVVTCDSFMAKSVWL